MNQWNQCLVYPFLYWIIMEGIWILGVVKHLKTPSFCSDVAKWLDIMYGPTCKSMSFSSKVWNIMKSANRCGLLCNHFCLEIVCQGRGPFPSEMSNFLRWLWKPDESNLSITWTTLSLFDLILLYGILVYSQEDQVSVAFFFFGRNKFIWLV